MQEEEIRIIAESVVGDPSRFEIELTRPLSLDETWELALLEIVVNSELKLLRGETDIIEIVKRPSRKKRTVESTLQKVHNTSLNLRNYFPLINQKISSGEKTLSEFITEIFDQESLISKENSQIRIAFGLALVAEKFESIQNANTEPIWSRSFTKEVLEKMGIGPAWTPLPDVPTNLPNEFGWFESLRIRFYMEAQDILKALYLSVFNNTLNLYAIRTGMGTGELWGKLDALITRITSPPEQPAVGDAETSTEELSGNAQTGETLNIGRDSNEGNTLDSSTSETSPSNEDSSNPEQPKESENGMAIDGHIVNTERSSNQPDNENPGCRIHHPVRAERRKERGGRTLVLTKDYISSGQIRDKPAFHVSNYFAWFVDLRKHEDLSETELWNRIRGVEGVLRIYAKTGMELQEYTDSYNYLLFLTSEFENTRPDSLDPLSAHFLSMLDIRDREIPLPRDPSILRRYPWFERLCSTRNETEKETWNFVYNQPFANTFGDTARTLGLPEREFFLSYDRLLAEAYLDDYNTTIATPVPDFSPQNYYGWFASLMKRTRKNKRQLWRYLYGRGYPSRLNALHNELGVTQSRFLEMRRELLKRAMEYHGLTEDSNLTIGLVEMLSSIEVEMPAESPQTRRELFKQVMRKCDTKDERDTWSYLFDKDFHLRFREAAGLLEMSEVVFFKQYDRLLDSVSPQKEEWNPKAETIPAAPRFRIANYLDWFRRLQDKTSETQEQLWDDLYEKKQHLEKYYVLSGLSFLDFVRSYVRLKTISMDEKSAGENSELPSSLLLMLQHNDNIPPPLPSDVENVWLKTLSRELGEDEANVWHSLYESEDAAKNFVSMAKSLNIHQDKFFSEYDNLLTLANETQETRKRENDKLRTIDVSSARNLEDLERITVHVEKTVNEMRKDGITETSFEYLDSTRKVILTVGNGEEVRLRGRLPEVYSLPKLMGPGEVHISSHWVDPYLDNRTFYLYSDVTREILLGESYFPVLAAVPLTKGTLHARYQRPVFLSLNKNHVVRIRLALYNEVGEKVCFVGNKPTIIKLLLRKNRKRNDSG